MKKTTHSKIVLIAIAAIISLLSGCSYPQMGSYKRDASALGERQVLHSSFDQFEFIKPESGDYKFNITKDSQAYDFGNGKTYYHGIDVSSIGPTRLKIESRLSAPDLRMAHLLKPIVIQLNSDFNLILETEEPLEAYKDMRGFIYSFEFNLEDDCRYLIIHSNPERHGEKFEVENPVYVTVVPLYFKFQVPYGPTGRLALKMNNKDL